MPQLMLQGFPDGAIRIGPVVSVLRKEGWVTYFVGPDNYFSHAAGDAAGQRMACPAHDKAIGTLLAELTRLNFLHPETHARMICQLA